MAHCRRPDTCVIARRDTGVRFQDLFLFHLIVLLINIHLLLFIIIVYYYCSFTSILVGEVLFNYGL